MARMSEYPTASKRYHEKQVMKLFLSLSHEARYVFTSLSCQCQWHRCPPTLSGLTAASLFLPLSGADCARGWAASTDLFDG